MKDPSYSTPRNMRRTKHLPERHSDAALQNAKQHEYSIIDVTHDPIKYCYDFWLRHPFGTGRGFYFTKKSGLFPKGWPFAKPKTNQNAAEADVVSFYFTTT
ncbi:MAG: hypothetical protein NTX44_12140 [Ignavibacteriales bacterium]|nr:hypothetical protein [Ignavibacteriales bacterium]